MVSAKHKLTHYIAYISNLLLLYIHANIDIILFANRLFLASMKPAKLQFGNDGKM